MKKVSTFISNPDSTVDLSYCCYATAELEGENKITVLLSFDAMNADHAMNMMKNKLNQLFSIPLIWEITVEF